jgi:hypothetical protein
MKRRRARFDTLVARYYPAVYSFASRLTDDPREAVTDIMMPPKGPSSATRPDSVCCRIAPSITQRCN